MIRQTSEPVTHTNVSTLGAELPLASQEGATLTLAIALRGSAEMPAPSIEQVTDDVGLLPHRWRQANESTMPGGVKVSLWCGRGKGTVRRIRATTCNGMAVPRASVLLCEHEVGALPGPAVQELSELLKGSA